MSRVAVAHADWLSLLDTHGQFLTLPVLREAMPDGLDRARPELRAEVRDRLAAITGDVADRTAWLEFLLRDVLGWGTRLRSDVVVPAELSAPVPEHNLMLRPDYALVAPAGAGQTGERARVLVMCFPLGTDLTTRIPGEKWVASPIDRVARLCRATGVPVGIATDTNFLALVSARVDKPVGYGIWPTELLGEEQGLLDSLISVLGAKRFFAVRTDHQLETLLVESASKEHEVTTQLGKQVRRAVEMLVAALSRANNEHGGRLLAGVDPHAVYESAVTVMMRLVFLLYAEERHLLPLGDPLYDTNYAASTLREQLRAEADIVGDEPLELRATAWHRLLATFRAVHAGITHDQLRLPAYGGSLFDPDRFPFLEGRAADEPWRHHPAAPLPVDDATVLAALTALQVLEIRDGGVTESRKLSFRTLDVEQIGHVYEGLLDHGAMRVEEVAVGLVGKNGSEAEVPLDTVESKAAAGHDTLVAWLAEQTGKSAAAVEKALATPADADLTRLLHTACENNATVIARVLPYSRLLRDDLRGLPMVFLPGSVYVTETTSRRDTGTEYTTKELAEEIVRYTLEPLVYEPGPAQGTPPDQWRLKSSDEILALQVADPAVGSGAVIVAGCRYLADKLVEAWVAEGKAAAPDDLADDVDDLIIEARRAVADQCLYGVDRDPMAVEMAKLSIWLTTMARERPFSFLDHAFRAGDSLLGVHRIDQLERMHIDPERSREQIEFTDVLTPRVVAAIRARRRLEAIRVLEMRDATEKARLNAEANAAVRALNVIGDLVSGAALSAPVGRSEELDNRMFAIRDKVAEALDPALSEQSRNDKLDVLEQQAAAWLNSGRPEGAPIRRPLHWPVAFPEVFEDGGFSAFVGNPPYMGNKYWRERVGSDLQSWAGRLLNVTAPDRIDLCVLFLRQAWRLLRRGGTCGFLAPLGIRRHASAKASTDFFAKHGRIYRTVTDVPWPGQAAVHVNLLWFSRHWEGVSICNGQACEAIDGSLSPKTISRSEVRRLSTGPYAFMGTDYTRAGALVFPADSQYRRELDEAGSPFLRQFISGEDITDHGLQGATRWCVDTLNLSLNQIEAESAATAEYLRAVVAPSRAHDDGSLPPRWWQFHRHRAPDYLHVRRSPWCLVTPKVSKFWMVLRADSSWVYNNKVVVLADLPPGQEAALYSDLCDAWVWDRSGRMKKDLSVTVDAVASFPLPVADAVNGTLAGQWHDALSRAMSLRGGATSALNALHDPSCEADEVVAMRRVRSLINREVASALGVPDSLLDLSFRDTSYGPRYTFDSVQRGEILEHLLDLNAKRQREESLRVDKAAPRRGRGQVRRVSEDPGLFVVGDDWRMA